MMRILKWIVMLPLLAVIGWGAWWWLGAEAQERALAGWLESREAKGWQAEYQSLEVTGFPMRFERRIEELILTDPEQGWSLRAPWIASESETFGPNRFTVTAAPDLSVSVPGETVAVSTDANRFELGVAASPSMPLDDVSVSLDGLTLGGSGWEAEAGRLSARVAGKAPDAAPENSYDVDVEALDVVLPEALLGQLGGRLEPRLDTLSLKGYATLDHALDRDFVEEGELSARTLVIRRAEGRWGEMRLEAEGRVDADPDGYAEGTIDLAVTNWKQMLRVAERSGAIGSDMASGIETALGLVSLFGSRSDAVELPLTLKGRRIWLGPVSIGDAPRISFPPRDRG